MAAPPLPSAYSRKAPLGEAHEQSVLGSGLQVGVASPQQQLEFALQHIEPPLGATQWPQSFLGAQVALPFAFFLQQMTKPGFPQVDLAAHF